MGSAASVHPETMARCIIGPTSARRNACAINARADARFSWWGGGGGCFWGTEGSRGFRTTMTKSISVAMAMILFNRRHLPPPISTLNSTLLNLLPFLHTLALLPHPLLKLSCTPGLQPPRFGLLSSASTFIASFSAASVSLLRRSSSSSSVALVLSPTSFACCSSSFLASASTTLA
ncbi:hypothetical protein S7711_02012 [Stachybotrys chartarum IBT 7711]|uniref:Uncharacterized protein n=1 Tax=Stachybotrys chartarum (strain CBS 109288 / IBT 7711) TaxID=1280523 RepID=A0A084AVZ5_STACB|nr:hypothetical protein S7711_02012 [Stachybotrys chartarum IBT 7711]